ncbi:FAD-NAD(P)-binding domain superfamily [Babesia duncani]|uniref:FAD-NAD(P)-binding domain superfamily n=1 Tax=Babesia duncani TaxID=323732 RepID=A0AAD9PGG6_9APIC|nr:FAD-NAD(P)-binding domain superfamily [Babesia duncani]KAK2197787.1 FAD-NAD(P)-binding domain superfamily [Babesia duncani]
MMLKTCIVGAGPSGLYFAKYLKSSPRIAKPVIFERLAEPFGLLRFGVAPDRPAIRNSVSKFESLDCHMILNTLVGTDVTIEDLLNEFDRVVLACGAQEAVKLDIQPPLHARGIFDAIDLVRWYNSFPDLNKELCHYFKNLDPDPTIAIIGAGNVALDVARILTTPPQALESTSINRQVLQELRRLCIRRVHVIGRGEWVHAKFTSGELRKVVQSRDIRALLDPRDYIRGQAVASKGVPIVKSRLSGLYSELSARSLTQTDSRPVIHLSFGKRLCQIIGHSNHLELIFNPSGSESNSTGTDRNSSGAGETRLRASLLLTSLGMRQDPIAASLASCIDNRRVFGCGWLATGGQGDLSSAIAQARQLAAIIHDNLDQFEPTGTR